MILENGLLQGFFARGFLKHVGGISYELKCLTSGLDKSFPSIRASKMPEYIEAVKAMERYKLALQGRLGALIERNRRQVGYE